MRLRQAHAIVRIPWHGADQLLKKRRGLSRMSRTHQQRSCWVLAFKRIADHQRHSPQEYKSSFKIARLQSDVRKSKHVGRSEVAIIDITGKNKFQHFAGGLFVTGLLKVSGRFPQYVSRRRMIRVSAITIDDRIQAAGLGRRLQLYLEELRLPFPHGGGECTQAAVDAIILFVVEQ